MIVNSLNTNFQPKIQIRQADMTSSLSAIINKINLDFREILIIMPVFHQAIVLLQSCLVFE